MLSNLKQGELLFEAKGHFPAVAKAVIKTDVEILKLFTLPLSSLNRLSFQCAGLLKGKHMMLEVCTGRKITMVNNGIVTFNKREEKQNCVSISLKNSE